MLQGVFCSGCSLGTHVAGSREHLTPYMVVVNPSPGIIRGLVNLMFRSTYSYLYNAFASILHGYDNFLTFLLHVYTKLIANDK